MKCKRNREKNLKGLHKAIALLIVLSSQIVFVQVIHAQEGQITINPTDDTYTDISHPSSNYGGQSELVIELFGDFPGETWSERTYYVKVVWLRFNLSEVPDGGVVDIATLELYSRTVTDTYEVQASVGSDNSWTEFTLTWNNSPMPATPLDRTFVGSDSQWYSWNVTDAVRENLNGVHGSPDVVTMMLMECCDSRGIGSQASFWSKEGPAESKPKLTIHWTNIIPEFQPLIGAPFFVVTCLMVAIFYKRLGEFKNARLSRRHINYLTSSLAFQLIKDGLSLYRTVGRPATNTLRPCSNFTSLYSSKGV